jgi:hypothetical protein
MSGQVSPATGGGQSRTLVCLSNCCTHLFCAQVSGTEASFAFEWRSLGFSFESALQGLTYGDARTFVVLFFLLLSIPFPLTLQMIEGGREHCWEELRRPPSRDAIRAPVDA